MAAIFKMATIPYLNFFNIVRCGNVGYGNVFLLYYKSCVSNFKVHITLEHHTTTTILRPFFQDRLGEPVPEENFWTLWCKGRLTETDSPTATPSGLTSAHLHHPPSQQCQSSEGNWCIWIREKTLEFSSRCYLHRLHTNITLEMTNNY